MKTVCFTNLELSCLIAFSFSFQGNQAVLVHWAKFLKFYLGRYHPSYDSCRSIFAAIGCQLLKLKCDSENSDCVAMIDALEWLIHFSACPAKESTPGLWLMFGVKTSTVLEPDYFLEILPFVVKVLLFACDITPGSRSSTGSQALILLLYKIYPQGTLEALVALKGVSFLQNTPECTLVLHIANSLVKSISYKSKILPSPFMLIEAIKELLGSGAFVSAAEWHIFHTFVSHACSAAVSERYLFPLLSNTIHEFFKTGIFLKDARVLKEAEESWCRTNEYCVLLIGRAFDTGAWKRSLNDVDILTPAICNTTILGVDIDVNSKIVPEKEFLTDLLKSFHITVDGLCQYCDSDKYTPLFVSFTGLCITPILRQTAASPFFSDIVGITLLLNLKLWKVPVWEGLIDNRFFPLRSKTWAPLVSEIMHKEPERMLELLSKIGSSHHIRDDQVALSCQMIRKVGYLFMLAGQDYYQSRLPVIQEKLNNCFKNSNPSLRIEALLCVSCMYMSFSPNLLLSYWPTVVHQLLEVFESLNNSVSLSGQQIVLLNHALLLARIIDFLKVDTSVDWIFSVLSQQMEAHLKKLGKNDLEQLFGSHSKQLSSDLLRNALTARFDSPFSS